MRVYGYALWMPTVAPQPTCPPGLEYLTLLDEVIVQQEVELLEIMLQFETENSYTIYNKANQKCYYAFEKSNCCARQWCGPNRCFEIIVQDNFQKTVFTIYRPYKCLKCGSCVAWCSICQDEVQVTALDGTRLGKARQRCSCCRPHFIIMDQNSNPQFEICGPFCQFTLCCKSIQFKVRSVQDGTQIGAISKYRGDFAKEAFSDADTFGVTFPIDLDVRLKATLIGCVFLIDFMFFEDPPKKKDK
ncbi:phospholipid scramblase 1-like [Physella acuta]|uniref:phospholipid scramblase 1-like n=1 Tax=Physella acuta TaxID=109671 RepID=UPI0027DD5B5E|nr:phospholipid scramblase 1-like [Physella acuta]